jgi:Protein of unknown function (DUF2934)
MDEPKRSTPHRNRKGAPTNSPPSFDPLRFVTPLKAAKSREVLIAELAYFRAQSRGFEPGHEVEDWLAAEAEIEKRNGTKLER